MDKLDLTVLEKIPSVRTVIHTAYLIRHRKTGMIYVGSTCKPGGRMSRHRSSLRNGYHDNKNLQAIYNDCQDIDFIFYQVQTKEQSLRLEKALIEYYHPRGVLLNVELDPINNKRDRGVHALFLKKGREKALEKSRKISINGKVYTSVREAARQLGLSKSSVASRAMSPKRDYVDWYYVDVGKKYSRPDNFNSRSVIIRVNNKDYTLADYSRVTGIPIPTLQGRLRLGIAHKDLHKSIRKPRRPDGHIMLVTR